MTDADLLRSIADAGLAFRGAFHPEPEDRVPALPGGAPVATLVLLGFAGTQEWRAPLTAEILGDPGPDPLDRWSRRTIEGLAERFGGVAFFPFGGPPHHPFGAWARRAEPAHPSPLGLLIHPDWGLWHSYRGGLGFAARLPLCPADRRPSPCESCRDRPCLAACPVGAFRPGGYDIDSCTRFLDSGAGMACMEGSCLARRACPVGVEHRYGTEQASFYMRAFLAAHR